MARQGMTQKVFKTVYSDENLHTKLLYSCSPPKRNKEKILVWRNPEIEQQQQPVGEHYAGRF